MPVQPSVSAALGPTFRLHLALAVRRAAVVAVSTLQAPCFVKSWSSPPIKKKVMFAFVDDYLGWYFCVNINLQ
jgi:hypothetical protein